MKPCPYRIYMISMDRKKVFFKVIIITVVIISVFFLLSEAAQAAARALSDRKKGSGGALMACLQDIVLEPYLPGIGRLYGGTENITTDIYKRWILEQYPVFLYAIDHGAGGGIVEESDYAALMLLEGSDEDRKAVAEDGLEYDENAMHLEQSMEDALLAENGLYAENRTAADGGQQDGAGQNGQGAAGNADGAAGEAAEGTAGGPSGGQQGTDAQGQAPPEFTPVEQKNFRYNWNELQEYTSLVKAFYAVDSTTAADGQLLNAQTFLSKDMSLQGGSDRPQILIYHTHSQEAFADSVPGDASTTIVGVGEYLAAILSERYGYQVIHHTGSYDSESRDYAYSNALPALEQLLAENPSIEVVIDLHRDAVPEDRRLVVDLQGRPTAQFMFFNGLSRTSKGEIAYLENPNLADNLAFSFQMQTACNEYYPGLARRIYLKAYRYNMHLRPKTLLIELGAQNNTVEEEMNACEPLAHVLHLVLSGTEPER